MLINILRKSSVFLSCKLIELLDSHQQTDRLILKDKRKNCRTGLDRLCLVNPSCVGRQFEPLHDNARVLTKTRFYLERSLQNANTMATAKTQSSINFKMRHDIQIATILTVIQFRHCRRVRVISHIFTSHVRLSNLCT